MRIGIVIISSCLVLPHGDLASGHSSVVRRWLVTPNACWQEGSLCFIN